MKFLIDNQLPTALARFLTHDIGVEAIHVRDLGLDSADDRALWSYCAKHDLIVVSKDEDFVTLFFQYPIAKLLWVRVRNCRRLELLDVFGRNWPRIILRFEAVEGFVELR